MEVALFCGLGRDLPVALLRPLEGCLGQRPVPVGTLLPYFLSRRFDVAC